MSLAVPVSEPSGSPLDLASALGTGAPATSASVIAFGAVVGAAGVCPKLGSAKQQRAAKHSVSRLLLAIFILVSPLFPDCILKIGPIENTDDAEQTDGQPEEDYSQPRGIRIQSQAEHADHKSCECYENSDKYHH